MQLGRYFQTLVWFMIGTLSIPGAFAQTEKVSGITAPKLSEINMSVFRYLYECLGEVYSSIYQGIISLGDFIETAEWLYHSLSKPAIRAQIVEFSIEFTTSLLIALAVERLLALYMRPIGNKFRSIDRWHHFWRDGCNVFFCIVPIFAFGLAFYGSFSLLDPVGDVYLKIATIFINGVTGAWALIRASILVLRPHTQDSLIPFTIQTLHKTHSSLRRIALTALVGYFTVEIGNIIGLPQAGHKHVIQFTTLVILIFASILVWNLHDDFREWLKLRRTEKGILPWKKRFLALMHFLPLLTVYTITLVYLTWVLPLDPILVSGWKILGTALLLPILAYTQYILGLLQEYWVEQHLSQFAPDTYKKAKFYKAQIGFVLTSLFTIILVLFAIWFWGGDPLFLLTTKIGQEISEKVLSIVMVIGLSLFLLRFAKGILNRYLDPSKIHGISPSERARMKTLHSISLNVFQLIIWLPAALLVLAELDIDILPAVATVGVLGVGLSFGIQSVVKDFVTGLFMLVEDSFAVGDSVNINGKIGSVESLTVRVLRLRSMDGSLSSIPYGSIDSIANYTRTYSVSIILVTIGRGEDVEKVCHLIQQLDTKLQEKNEEVKSRAVEPAVIDGVTEVTPGAVTLRMRIKTKPKDHWKIKRIYDEEITKLLDSKGIDRGAPLQAVIEGTKKSHKK